MFANLRDTTLASFVGITGTTGSGHSRSVKVQMQGFQDSPLCAKGDKTASFGA